MSCCDCTQVKDLGCVDPCDDEILIGVYDQTGTHTIEVNDGVKIQYIGFAGVMGNNIYVDASQGDLLNMGYTYTVKVIQPDDTQFTDGDGNDCFQFTTKKRFDYLN